MRKPVLALFVAAVALSGAERPARNLILFIGDAGGIATLNAASIYGHGQPQKLFIQRMPHYGLMDTSAATALVTDSAAAMTAIVTGQKVNNGVVSQALPPGPGQQAGQPLQTILEHAEQRGLATGVVSNSPMDDATPAACYAHASARKLKGEIFAQVLKPRFGDGVDLVIGAGRKAILDATAKIGLDLEPALRKAGFQVADSLEGVPAGARRAVALLDNAEFELAPVVDRSIEILSRNPKGFFLMVECDLHTDHPELGLRRALMLDKVIQGTVERMRANTLVIFAADHSFDLRMRSGQRGQPLVLPPPVKTPPAAGGPRPHLRVDDGHTGEEVLVTAAGPGAARVKGFFPNTQLFHIMMAGFGWEK